MPDRERVPRPVESDNMVYPRAISSRWASTALMRSRPTPTLYGLLVAGLVVLSGCGSNDSDGTEERYSATDLQRGVTVSVEDPLGAVVSATVLLPDDLPSYLSLHPELAAQNVVVTNPGEGGYDVLVVYRTGPYCGLLPAVSIDGDTEELTVDVRSRSEGDCDAVEYDEAIGLDLSAEFEQAEVSGTHHGG